MFQRLATQIREQLNALIDQYDAQLRTVPGYTNLPQAARRDLEQHVLQLIAACLEANDDSQLIQYIHERAEQVLTHGFQPEWFQQAVTIPQDIIAPLVKTVAESHFVWHALGHAQTTAWEIVAQERRRVEQTLRESEARYQTIFDSTPVMFWLKDTQNRTLRINKAAAEFEGVKPADVENKSAYDLYPREQAEAFYQDDLAVIRSNQPKLGIIEQHTSVGTGKLMWVETGKTPVHNEQGETIGVLAFGVDVTERKQAEEVLRRGAELQQRTSQHLRAALEAASELIQVQDLDTLYRRTVELAREKFEVERCGLYMVDESREQMWGTYGTDDQRQTTDERGSQRTTAEFVEILTASSEQLWVVRETPHVYVEEGVQHVLGTGWVVGTLLRGAAGPIGILFNDSALSGRSIDEAQQEALAIYCSIIGSIIERKQLEEQIQKSLARRSAEVQASTEVAQEIASATDLNELFKRVVTLVKERFTYYHTQLFRYEPTQEAVVLITGYGETGQQMLEAGHRLQMGRGVVGTAAATGKSILASDVRQDADWRPNPYLPETRGELAVPIKWRDQVLGILDVQSDRAGALGDDDRLLLEGLCGQIASALESTRLLEELRRNEVQLSEALKIARLGYWEYDVEKDLFHFNDQFYAIFHTTAEQAGGYQLSSAQYAQQFVHPDDLPIVGAEIEKALNSTDRHYNRQLEHRVRYADGGVGYISVNINIERDEHGRILRYYGANQDITESKLAEQEFLRFKQGLEQASDAVFMTDDNGHIIYVNPAFEKIYGYSRVEVIGQTPRILKSGQLSQEFYQNFWQALLNKQSVSGEKPNKTKDGRVIIIEDSNSPILDSAGNLVGFLSTHRDITERKQAEQRMAETLRETERLYAAVGHEDWQTYRQTGQLGEGYLFNQALLQPADKVWEPEMAQALEQQALITSRSERRAVAVSPLAVRGEAIGALGVYDDPTHPLSKDDLQLIKAVSEQVALALESARLFDQTQMALADTRALFRFSDLASRETEIKPIYDSVAQLLVEETGFAGAWIAQVDTQARVLRGIAGAGAGMGPDRNFDVIPYQHMQTPATIAARDRVMIVVNDPLHDERLSDLPQQMKVVIGKAIAMPVIIDGEIESIIAATRPVDGLDIGERDQRLLQTAAAQVASAIQRARLFEQTQRDAEREHTINRVTSRIRNARSVDEVLSIAAQELRLATRASRSVVEILPAADQPASVGNGEGVKA